jgi:hypothetical protein
LVALRQKGPALLPPEWRAGYNLVMKTLDVTEKARIYHTLAQMSSSFSSIVQYCADLERAGALPPERRRLFQAFTVEVQGELNLEILHHMENIEMEHWTKGGKVRDRWEKYLRGEPEPRKKSPNPRKSSRRSRTRAGSGAK